MYAILIANNFDMNIDAVACQTRTDAQKALRRRFIRDLRDCDIILGEDGVPVFPEAAVSYDYIDIDVDVDLHYTQDGYGIYADGDLIYAQLKEIPIGDTDEEITRRREDTLRELDESEC